MKKIYIKYIAIMICGVMAACTKDKTDATLPQEPVPVDFRSGIATRADNGQWQNDDRIGIFMIKAWYSLNDQTIVQSADNMQYIAQGGASSQLTEASPSDVIYFPIGDEVDFIAYYPYVPSSELLNYTISADVSDQSAQPAQDILYSNNAKTQSEANPQVELTFNHSMSKIVVNTTLGSEFEGQTIDGVRFAGFVKDGTLSLSSGKWKTGETGTITPYADGDTYTAHMIPQAAADNHMFIFEVGSKTVNYQVASDLKFIPGTSYTFNLVVGRDGIMDATVTIADWEVAQLPDSTVGALSSGQIKIVWDGYNDDSFSGIEILTSDGLTYSAEVAPDADGLSSQTVGLMWADPATIVPQKIWVYYLGKKLELADDDFSVSDGVLTINSHTFIAKREHLEYINSSAEALAGSYIQITDIDLGGSAEPWTPIGSVSQPFTGEYDGGGYNLDNIYLDISGNTGDASLYGALFGYSHNGSFRNIHLASGSITGVDYIAGLCGTLVVDDNSKMAIFENCVNSADISGRHYIAGLCSYIDIKGSSTTVILHCINHGNLNGVQWVAGIASRLNAFESGTSLILCSYNTGDITTKNYYSGGIVGWHYAYDNGVAAIMACYNTGTITGGNTAGGVCGLNWVKKNDPANAYIAECYNASPVMTGGKNIGAICGSNSNAAAQILTCYWANWGAGSAVAVCGANTGTLADNVAMSAANWPGIRSTPGYWELYTVGGYWKSFGAWGTSSMDSVYPTLAELPLNI